MRRLWLLCVAVMSWSALAIGQTFASQPVDLEGKVDRYTLSINGVLDGFLLEDGTEVLVAPYLAHQLGHAVRRGETVRITGLRLPGLRTVIASFVYGENTHESVIDRGDPGGASFPPATGTPDTLEEGLITQLLHGPEGRVNGALIDNDLIVRLPANASVEQLELLVVGQRLAVKGEEFDGEYGRVIRIEAAGPSYDELVAVPPLETESEAAPPSP